MVGVAIAEADIRGARALGWDVWKMLDVISNPNGFLERLYRGRPKAR
jgi:hypothetical protein